MFARAATMIAFLGLMACTQRPLSSQNYAKQNEHLLQRKIHYIGIFQFQKLPFRENITPLPPSPGRREAPGKIF